MPCRTRRTPHHIAISADQPGFPAIAIGLIHAPWVFPQEVAHGALAPLLRCLVNSVASAPALRGRSPRARHFLASSASWRAQPTGAGYRCIGSTILSSELDSVRASKVDIEHWMRPKALEGSPDGAVKAPRLSRRHLNSHH